MAKVIEKYECANLGWLYYKHYYQSANGNDNVANRNETILKRQIEAEKHSALKISDCQIELKVAYPGLLTGSGYIHESVSDKEESFKIGFFFDHVTGMPCIPGHSVKGVLRSAFPNHENEKYPIQKTNLIVQYITEKGGNPKPLFEEYMKKCGISEADFSEKRFVEILGNIIFEGQEPYAFDKSKDEFLYQQISIYRRDIFHDAYISAGGKNNYFLGSDFITPHVDPMKNPNPIKFLKVLPEVNFRFQFDLKPILIDVDLKKQLFESILKDFGVGAKTNVGYGQFSHH